MSENREDFEAMQTRRKMNRQALKWSEAHEAITAYLETFGVPSDKADEAAIEVLDETLGATIDDHGES